MTRVLIERPPIFNELARVFPIVGEGVIFSWGDIIYNPRNVWISPRLFAHEAVHQYRQRHGIEVWWRRYIEDVEFRLHEEILGHRAELNKVIEMGMNRQQRRQTAKQIARRLAGPIYGRMISTKRALETITT